MYAEIYTKQDCPYCVKAKELLKERSIEYREYLIGVDIDESLLLENQQLVTKEQLLERYPAAKKVPQIWLDDNHIGGHLELTIYLNK